MRFKKLWPLLILLFAFLTEALVMIYNSAIGGKYLGNTVAESYAEVAKTNANLKEVVPGNIYDRNRNEIVSFVKDSSLNNGIYAKTEYQKIFTSVLGYSGSGLLSYCEKELKHIKNDSDEKGDSLILTIDCGLEEQTFSALNELINSDGSEDGKGSAVIMDADTGEILASVCLPAYDVTEITELIASKEVKESDINLPHTTHEGVSPGSTFKLIDLVVMFENDLETAEFPDDTSCKVDNAPDVHNYSGYRSNGGTIGYKDALRKSSNVYFVRALYDVPGIEEKLEEAAKRIYIGKTLKLDFGNVVSVWPYDVYDYSSNEEYERSRIIFGQGDIKITTLQDAMISAGMINDGNVMTPYMIKNTVNSDGEISRYSTVEDKGQTSANGTVLSSLTSSEYAAQILDAMKYGAIRQYGFDESLDAGAKSGTSEEDINGVTYKNAWMTSCVNLNGHNYAIAINWEHCPDEIQGSNLRETVESIYYYLRDNPLTYIDYTVSGQELSETQTETESETETETAEAQ